LVCCRAAHEHAINARERRILHNDLKLGCDLGHRPGVAVARAPAYLDSVSGEESIMFYRGALFLALGLSGLAVSSSAFAQQAARPAAAQQKEEKTFPKDSNWTLRAINGKTLPAGMEATLTIDGQFRGSGFSGCNTWSATMWPVRNQRFAVGPVALTKKQCDAAKMAFERTYLVTLHNRSGWDLVNGMLEVKGASGSLSFARGF
jgi:heat shock protein HslJ